MIIVNISVCLCACSQGAPGNRGFPGQDGLAGAKVSPAEDVYCFEFHNPLHLIDIY